MNPTESMTPDRLEEIIDLFGGEPTSATLAAEAQVDRMAGALADLSMAHASNWNLDRTAQRALRQLTFSPDGLPATWPSPELVATILAGEESLPYQPGYERIKKP